MNKVLHLMLKVNAHSFAIDTELEIDLSRGPIGLIGVSASGKSTFLKSIAGIQSCESLSASFADWSWEGGAGEANPCTYVSNTHGLFEHLLVKDNLQLVVDHSTFSNIKPIAYEHIVSQLNLSDLLIKSVSSLSGGETQRVLIARALLSGKPILLLDEVFTAMDWRTRQYVLQLLPTWQTDYGRCFVIVSHAIHDLAQSCASACLVKSGVFSKQYDINLALQHYFEDNEEHLFSNVEVQFKQTDDVFCVHEYVLSGSEQSIFVKTAHQSKICAKHIATLQIDADKVSLRYPSTVKSSILNCLQGTVVALQEQADKATVTLDVDGQLLYSTISKKSLHTMQIELGKTLVAEFKA